MKTPKLYVANGKLVHEVLQFRCPRTLQLRSLRVGAGQQVEVTGKYNADEIHQIVEQLSVYHNEVKTVAELKTVKNPRGLIFCLDKPIDADVISERIEKEKDLAQEIAAEEGERAGLAAFVAAKKTGGATETTLEVVQQDEYGNAARGDKAVNFEVGVSKRANGRQEGKRRRG